MEFEKKDKSEFKRSSWYPVPVSECIPEKSQFYNKELSQRFGNRFSFEKFVNREKENDVKVISEEQEICTGEIIENTDTHILIKKRWLKKFI